MAEKAGVKSQLLIYSFQQASAEERPFGFRSSGSPICAYEIHYIDFIVNLQYVKTASVT